ncbi:MAG: GntR family transcriptional regulator [Clostridiales Family XIII bacterium]|jgi:DNA-binding GntR family transcriptional regulator|nr:GntR family transcriptional regulator [Clostridiales Family XIII bacterium]
MNAGPGRAEEGSASHSLSQDIFSKLREDILTERLKPGEKLTEQRVCETYNVSRTPVREALKQLAAEGLLVTPPNRGAFVSGLSRGDMEDIFILREIYELQAVRWAIARITDGGLAELDEIWEFMEFYTKRRDTKKMTEINTNFHQLIYAASECRMLRHILSSYQIYIRYSRQTKPYSEAELPAIFAEHKRIFDAFHAADAEAGVRAMRAHIAGSRARALGDAARIQGP